MIIVTNVDEVDFGDLPDSYATTLLQNGARHEAIGPRLGATRDYESNGQPTIGATGDDSTASGGTDDEDGVTFGTVQLGQQNASVTVNVQGATASSMHGLISIMMARLADR